MPPIPSPTLSPSLYSDPKVQTALLMLIIGLLLWNTTRSIRFGERLVRLETIVTNHFSHRFDKLKKRLGMEWDDDLTSEESEE